MSIKKIPFSPPDITESEVYLVSEALRSGWITTGPKTKEFERLIAMCCQTDQAVCLNSATACMELILRVLGVGPGDEVITSAYTYTATASVTCHVGAKVVMVDTAPDSFEMDYDKLADAITEKTKVVLPVDLAGVVCDYDKIFAAVESKKHLFSPVNDIQKAYGRVIVLADAAHAFGAKWHGKMCGEIADFTSFSFHAVKNLTTAEGGALTWRNHDGVDNESLYKQFQLLSLHGQNKDALAKTRLGAWEYDIVGPWYKCNMTDVCAGIGLGQIRRYDGILSRRREIIDRYNKGEMMSEDSIHFPDSLKFKTHKLARTVYGGGGIMPDYFVPIDTTLYTKYHRQLRDKGALMKAHFHFIDAHRKEWLGKYKTFNEFYKRFEVTPDMLAQLVATGKEMGVEYNEEEYQKALPLLKLQMKALIARDLWDMNEYYHVINDANESIRKALELLEQPDFEGLLLKKR